MARDFSREFYHSKVWKETRTYILKRDNYLCRHCDKPAKEVHHIIHLSPKNINDPNITVNPDNLISLCRDCHFKEHYQDKAEGHVKPIDPKLGNNYLFDENGYVIPPT